MEKEIPADEAKFISDYLNKHMRNHGLPYNMQYLNLLAETEEKAKKAWIVFNNKINKVK